jgi:hypothetical protein
MDTGFAVAAAARAGPWERRGAGRRAEEKERLRRAEEDDRRRLASRDASILQFSSSCDELLPSSGPASHRTAADAT